MGIGLPRLPVVQLQAFILQLARSVWCLRAASGRDSSKTHCQSNDVPSDGMASNRTKSSHGKFFFSKLHLPHTKLKSSTFRSEKRNKHLASYLGMTFSLPVPWNPSSSQKKTALRAEVFTRQWGHPPQKGVAGFLRKVCILTITT